MPKLLAKHLKPALAVLALLMVMGLIFATNSRMDTACGSYRTDRVVTISGQAFNTEVASNSTEFERGLGSRPCILPNQAMLFAFKQPGQYPFWMKDMKFPIDIIWVGPDFKVAAIKSNLQPSTYPGKFANQPNRPAQYVLEVKANRSKELNLNLGTPVSF